jgi:hypothetical protein
MPLPPSLNPRKILVALPLALLPLPAKATTYTWNTTVGFEETR